MRHSVVVPLFDKRAYIGETIASLAAQEQPPDEILVVDDASTDGSAQEAERALARHAEELRVTRTEVVRRARNAGPGAARNVGIERATGDLISFLDADDCYRSDGLRAIGERMRAHALDLAVLGYESDPPGERFPDHALLAGELVELADDVFLLPEPLRTAAHPEFFMGRASNVVVRRRWLGPHRYCVASRLNEGIDFWYRVLKDIAAHAGARVGLIAAPLVRFRILGDSLSHRLCRDWRALELPPTILRYADSTDAHDRRLVDMLGRRWLEHALQVLPDVGQKRAFVAHHRAFLARLGVGTPLHGTTPP